jgi:5-methylcytosine-specific restriction endonuclease McrA
MIDRRKDYERWNRLRKQWLEAGKCRGCGNPEVVKAHNCLKCYLIRVSADRLGSGKHWKSLIELMERQNFRCGLTNQLITFSSDIALDHVVPICRGGKSKISNVRWVTKRANQIKSYFLDSELLDYCENLVNVLKMNKDHQMESKS